jgi:hypothetical protein
MGTRFPTVGVRGGGMARSAALLALALVFSLGSRASAADLTVTSGDSLNVTGASASLLPTTAASTSMLPTTAASAAFLPDDSSGSAEQGWLSGLHVSGFLSQTFGMWQNPENLRQYTTSRNSLATSRTWLQVDENYRLTENNNFFMREWFVYEPPYAWNSANGNGHYANGFYNQYTVRDAWWENKTGPVTTYVGNQIVVWGQSLAFRVGDVINPVDTTWAFGFANLEQSRIPQWMIHPIWNLPEWGPFESNFLEGVLDPRLQPMWNSCDYADHRYDGECNVNGGSVNNGFGGGISFDPADKYASTLTSAQDFYPGRTAIYFGSILPPHGQPFQNTNLALSGLSIENFYCINGPFLGANSQPFNIVPKRLRRHCTFDNKNGAADIGQWKIPASNVANWDEGIRFHTLVGGAELTAFYWNAWNLYPNVWWQPYTNQFRARFNPTQKVGVTGDIPLPMPSAVGEYLPFVGRAEGVYTNHESVFDYNYANNPSLIRYTDMASWMLALDIDQAYAPWLTATGNLNANIELYDEIALDANSNMFETLGPYTGGGPGVNSNNIKNNVSALLNIGTSWLWNDVEPAWTMIFNPKGRSFLLFPSVVLNPPWTKKYFMKLQAIEILSGDKGSQQAGGTLKGQSQLTAQFQYNFDLL